MSGGYFDYIQYRFEDIANEIEKLIATNDQKNEWGGSRSYSEETLDKFREAALAARKAGAMAQRVDWLVEGDESEESFHRRWKEEVVDKFESKH